MELEIKPVRNFKRPVADAEIHAVNSMKYRADSKSQPEDEAFRAFSGEG